MGRGITIEVGVGHWILKGGWENGGFHMRSVNAYICVCIHIYTYIYIHIHTYIHICIHVHKCVSLLVSLVYIYKREHVIHFWVWLILLNMIISTSIYILARDMISYGWVNINYVYMAYFIHSSGDAHRSQFHCLVIVSSSAINMYMQVSLSGMLILIPVSVDPRVGCNLMIWVIYF